MDIRDWQQEIDEWIKTHGVRYFDVRTNGLILMEEVGELARHLARQHGEQSYKHAQDEDTTKQAIQEEMADILFVLMCLANQMEVDLGACLRQSIAKKTKRDSDRHLTNPKLADTNPTDG